MMSKFLKGLFLVAALTLTGCGDDSSSGSGGGTSPDASANGAADASQPGDQEISITRSAFSPATVTIDTGDTVRWTNNSNRAESVTADPALAADDGDVQLPAGAPAFNSGMLNPGQAYAYTFVTPGRYEYFTLGDANEGPKGTILVEDANGNVPGEACATPGEACVDTD